MSRKRFTRSAAFEAVVPEAEEEIVALHSEVADFYLSELPAFLDRLRIPTCFTADIAQCVDYFYTHIYSKDVEVDPANARQSILLQLVKSYTITALVALLADVVDVVDLDKLIKNCAKLIRFRDHYDVILRSWALFVEAAGHQDALHCRLTLPDLQKIKRDLGLDMSDAMLIDMLGACATVGANELANYTWDKLTEGKFVDIKDFAEIMGQLGELD